MTAPAAPDARSLLRDAGGLRFAACAVRPGLALRVSGGLARPGELRQLEEAGIATVVDMRNEHEDRGLLAEWAAGAGVRVVQAPIFAATLDDLRAITERSADAEETVLAQRALYLQVVDVHGPQVVQALEALAGDGVVGFGCAAGKDRTGIVTAVLHVVLGATVDEACEAYVRLSPSVEQLLPLAGRYFGLADGAEPSPQMRAMLSVDPDTMRAVFEHLDRTQGGTVAWLTANGMRDGTLDRLRAKLLA